MGNASANVCPTCMAKYAGTVTACEADGTALVPEETFAHVDKDLAAGVLVGEYRVEGKLGQGGFGAVFRGVHPVIGKTVAIKVLSRQFSSNPQMVSRFIAEARAVNQIRHRNIIDIFSFGQLPDGRQYYVMELLEGTPFDRYLATHKRLSLRQALPIFRGIARALDAAHAKDILHRDLKPENVYLVFDEDGGVQPKLLDFGLVKLLTDSSGNHKTKTGTPMGTPYYMSPEQCRGLDVDRRADVYSFGVMVYEVLAGQMPFTGQSAMDILMKHMTAEPAPPSTVEPEVARELDAPILKMLAKDAADRPASVGEALEALLAAANKVGVAVTDSGAALPAPATLGGPVSESYHAAATVPAVSGAIDAAPLPAAAISTNDGAAAQIARVGEAPSAKGNTFLASETDVAAPRAARTRVLPAMAAVVLALAVGSALWISVTRISLPIEEPAPTPSAPAVATGPAPSATIPSATPSASETVTAPAPTEHAVRVDNAPKGAIVSAGGKELGAAPGPFTLRAGEEATLTISAKGYKSREVKLTPTADAVVDGSLDKPSKGVTGSGAGATAAPKGGGISPDLMDFDKK